MDRITLEEYNVGENLEMLMNLDPRGYGVCRILQPASRAAMGEPTTMHAAKAMCKAIKKDDIVYILTGFVLLPHKVPEMDGMISSCILCRALVQAFDAKPVIVCPSDCLDAVKACGNAAGLHVYQDLDTMKEMPMSMGVVPFTKVLEDAPEQAAQMMEEYMPAAVISNEAPGSNEMGVYHNAVGVGLFDMQARNDVLWQMLVDAGVPNMAIGDLGNEIGMGTITDHIVKYIPFAHKGGCKCGCGGGIVAKTKTDNIITATVSDWGCYAFMAALAYLKKDMSIMHDETMEANVMQAGARAGLIDMTGSLIPGIDGFDMKMNVSIMSLMRQCTENALNNSCKSEHWFGPTLEKEFFEGAK